MKKKSFKTNITCTGCISKVTPFLNEKAGEGNWEVNLRTKTKTLTLNNPEITDEELIDGLKALGYQATALPQSETEIPSRENESRADHQVSGSNS